MNCNVVFFGYGLYAGGAEANALHIFNYLLKKKVKADLVLLKNIHENHDRYHRYYAFNKFYHYFKDGTRLNPIAVPFSVLLVFFWFFNLARRNKYTVFISIVEYYPSFLITIISHILRKKNIVIIGDNLERDLSSRNIMSRVIHLFLINISLFLADKVVCVSYGLAHQMESKFNIPKDKIQVIYNGVPPCAKNKGLTVQKKGAPKKVIVLGRLVKKKDQAQLIESVRLIPLSIKCRYYIVGRGNEEHKLKKLVTDYGLQDTIRFVKNINKGPCVILRSADLFIFTSQYEGFGNTILEAMSCGLPVVSTNCLYGPQEILADKRVYNETTNQIIRYEKYGVLVDISSDRQKNRELISQAISTMLTSPKLLNKYRLQSIARSRFFSVEKMCMSYYTLILSLHTP